MSLANLLEVSASLSLLLQKTFSFLHLPEVFTVLHDTPASINEEDKLFKVGAISLAPTNTRIFTKLVDIALTTPCLHGESLLELNSLDRTKVRDKAGVSMISNIYEF